VCCTTTPRAIRRRRTPAQPLGIAVHDHIIVGKEGYASLKGLKLI
jgi:DNA repair protein RadC